MTEDIITLLLADDQEMVRVGFRMVLDAQQDMTVVGEVGDGRAAVDAVVGAPSDARPDLVLMDIRMPHLNGVAATESITSATDTKVLVLTTFDLDEYVYSALQAGASGFLLKDTRTAELHQALRAVSSGDAILTPRITRELLNRHMLRPIVTPQQRAAQQQLGMLSPREREVAELVAQGLTNAEIAQRLTIAADSVKKNVTRILGKLNLRDRVQLVILLRDAQS